MNLNPLKLSLEELINEQHNTTHKNTRLILESAIDIARAEKRLQLQEQNRIKEEQEQNRIKEEQEQILTKPLDIEISKAGNEGTHDYPYVVKVNNNFYHFLHNFDFFDQDNMVSPTEYFKRLFIINDYEQLYNANHNRYSIFQKITTEYYNTIKTYNK